VTGVGKARWDDEGLPAWFRALPGPPRRRPPRAFVCIDEPFPPKIQMNLVQLRLQGLMRKGLRELDETKKAPRMTPTR